MRELGGDVIETPSDVTFGGREPLEDVARNLERWVTGVVVRTLSQTRLREFAAAGARMHVVNALTDEEHPCQALADMLTLREHIGPLSRADAHVRRRRQQRRGVARARGTDARIERARGVAGGIRPAGPGRRRGDGGRARRRDGHVVARSRSRPSPAPTPSTPTSGRRWDRKTKPPIAPACSRPIR